MKKLLGIIILSLLVSNITFANKNKRTWDYPFLDYKEWEVKGSENHYKFQSNLREDKDVLKEFKNNKKTGIISYLLFEDDKIVIDVSDIPKKVSSGDTIIDGLLPSHSMGKSLVSYVTGHAICEGYIDNVNVKLDDWPLIKSTLYDNSVLLDLLNMKGGDQKWVGERMKNGSDNRIKGPKKENVNVIGLMNIQFAVQGESVFIIEVNPRASRTVPFISKCLGPVFSKISNQSHGWQNIKRDWVFK